MDSPDLPVLAVCGLALEAAIARGPGVAALCGPGTAVIERLDRLLAAHACACRGILSFGIAGGLDPVLPAGACVLAETVVAGGDELAVDERWLRALRARLPDAAVGRLAGSESPVAHAEDKSILRRCSGACAVDMESHWAGLAARRHGLPFAALRIVADPAHRSVPRCAIAGLGQDGAPAVLPLLRTLASDPGELPMLAILAADTFTALRRLRAARSSAGAAFSAPLI